MKLVLRLAVVVVTLLVVSNMAFAGPPPCDQEFCYNVNSTDQNGNPWTGTWRVCLYNDGTGFLNDEGGRYLLRLFGGGPGWFNTNGDPSIGGNPRWSSWILHTVAMSYYIQPLEGGLLLSAIGIGGNGSVWFTTNAILVPLSSCPVPG